MKTILVLACAFAVQSASAVTQLIQCKTLVSSYTIHIKDPRKTFAADYSCVHTSSPSCRKLREAVTMQENGMSVVKFTAGIKGAVHLAAASELGGSIDITFDADALEAEGSFIPVGEECGDACIPFASVCVSTLH